MKGIRDLLVVASVLAPAVVVAGAASAWLAPGPRAALGAVYALAGVLVLITGRRPAGAPAYGAVSPSGRLLSVRWLSWRTDPATGALAPRVRVWHIGTDATHAARCDALRGEWRA